MKEVSANGISILLARVGGEFHAVGAKCPHYGAPLAEGALCGTRVVCPWHHACFDVTTGGLEEPPALDSLPRYEVRVEDAGGAAVGGASVVVTNLDTGRSLTAASDGEGRYRFAFLPVGPYLLRAGRPGFAAYSREFVLTLGQAADLTVRLGVAGIEESVEVSDAGGR